MPLPPPVVHTDPTAQFVFERRGGAIIHARLSIWDDPGGPNQKRVDVLFFEDSLDAKETFTRTLPAGIYDCVLLVFIREDHNGTYDYLHLAAGDEVGRDGGDVNTSGAPGEGRANRHEYVLVVA